MKFPESVILEWCEEFLGEGKAVSTNGSEYKYHEFAVPDKKRKLYVNVDKSVFDGKKSGLKGPFEKLVAEYNGWSVKKARQYLLKRFNKEISLEDLYKDSEEYDSSKKYVSPEVIEKAWSNLPEQSFRLKLNDKFSIPYINYLKKRGMDDKFIYKCYYSMANNYKDKYFKLQDYVIIPFYDKYDKVYYWQARAIVDRQPRYLHCPDSRSSEHVWNIDIESSEVVITEGVFDAEKFDNCAISILSKEMSEEQERKILARQFDKIILGGNNEEFVKGPNSTLKIFKRLKEHGQNVFIFDWNSFCKFHKISVKDFSEVTIKKKLKLKDVNNFLINNAFEAEVKIKLFNKK